MELGADAVLLNSSISYSKNPSQMAYAMNLAIKAGRLSYLSGQMVEKKFAISSSPGVI